MKADAEFGRKMLANEKRKKLTKVEKEIVKLITPKRVKKCRRDFGYLDSTNLSCRLSYGHKGKHEAIIKWT